MNGDVTDNVTASETPEGFHEEMREANKEIDRLKEEYEKLEKDYAGKIKEFNNLLEVSVENIAFSSFYHNYSANQNRLFSSYQYCCQ